MKKFNIKLSDLISHLIKKNIFVRPLWQLNHKQKQYKSNENYNISIANFYFSRCLCLPSNPDLRNQDIKYISTNIINYLIKI